MNKEHNTLINVSRRLLLEGSLSEKQIAKIIHVSETTLRELYNKNFGMPPKRYIRRVKMKKAQTLLRITDKSVSEIANCVGYVNTSKFSAVFKAHFGITPSHYRKIVVLE